MSPAPSAAKGVAEAAAADAAVTALGGARDDAWRRRLLLQDSKPFSPAEAAAFAAFALERVSRTFALNIRVLPEPLRGQVLHAYLYCRMADTIEDDPALPAAEKSALLRTFASLFHPELAPESRTGMAKAFPTLLPLAWRVSPGVVSEQTPSEPLEWEKVLLAQTPLVVEAFSGYPAPSRVAIGECVRVMCEGMADFAMRQDRVGRGEEPLIRTLEDLDRYCWFVAGTVGVMLCDLFIGHAKIVEPAAGLMRAHRVSFGNGLQLVNILKDLADDRARGVSWMPAALLEAEGITAAGFGMPEHRDAAARVHATLFAKTLRHLEEALAYTLAIPRRQRRLRLFCLWPLLMAAETLALLAENTGAVADGARLKITRDRVARIVRMTGLLWWSDGWLRAEFARSARRIRRAMKSALNERPAADTFASP